MITICYSFIRVPKVIPAFPQPLYDKDAMEAEVALEKFVDYVDFEPKPQRKSNE